MQTQPPNPKTPFFRRWDILLVAALLLCALAWLFFSQPPVSGAVALVSIGTGEAQQTREIPLGKDDTIAISGGAYPVTLEIKGGAIRFVSSACPDHVCEDFGWLKKEGEWALCAPAGVLVRIVEP